ncbi:GNAT family N-acetyltransferase [Ferdinandcohnia quinoae]|uniref:GNAT family N-acetyltransferase n=1 Tax=Fredinandcohnia quinoae TaxID=2918902 RepID=A0AAW5EE59_9BACI|nr:GNAT family N-acetyltransferase [Fredinandcohnia sp. SECRCQ15]MCH1627438.1 GNAT family N-acetyltransferase [Fredinandcohnia sp. SECRCQ15]
MAHDIRELTTVTGWKEAFPVMKQLRTHLDEEQYVQLVSEMQKKGYRMFALYKNEAPVAVTGVGNLLNLYHGNNMFVYDLVTDEAGRSQGYGEILLSYIHDLAVELGCANVVLSSGLQRTDAHRFYEDKMGYNRTSYVFVKNV